MNEKNEPLQEAAEVVSEEKNGKLSFADKTVVSTGGLTMFLGNNSVNALGMAFYNMMLKVNPSWIGVALSIPRLYEAFADPLMGTITDNFRSKYGRRRPFILLGAVLMMLSFGLIWMVPLDLSEKGKIIWFVVTSLVFYTAFTIFSIPYVSLTYEMSPDYDERTSVQGYVTFWSKTGELLYQAVIPLAGVLVSWKLVGDKTYGVRVVTWVYAVVGMGILGGIPAIFGKERYYELNVREKKEAKDPFWKTITHTMKNMPFVMMCLISVATMFAGMFASCMDYYLLVYYMFNGDLEAGASWKLIVTVGYATMGFVGIPIIVGICKRTTKLQALQFVYGLMMLNAVLRWFIYQPGNQHWIWLDPLTGGMFWIGVGTVMQSMVADICDDDELRNGTRREGMFGAMFQWATKLSIALSWALAGVLLDRIGFDAKLEANQTAATFMSMRVSMCFGAALPALMCFILMRFYPLTKEKSEENRRLLEARRGAV